MVGVGARARDRPTVVSTTLELSVAQSRELERAGARVGRGGRDRPQSSSTADLRPTEVWLGHGLDAGLLRQMPDLAWVQTGGAGVEDYLFPELVRSPIVLTNAGELHARTVAAHAVGLLIVLARRVDEYIRQQDAGLWQPLRPLPMVDMTVTVVGFGRIGRSVGRICSSLGMRVIGVRRNASIAAATSRGATIVGPDRLTWALSSADWIVAAAPRTATTLHLIGPAELAVMKPSAVLVNVGRGWTIDQPALIRAVEQGHLAGAGLDVFETEPLPPDSPLWHMPGIVITPHVAGVTANFQDGLVKLFCRNLRRFRLGRPLLNVVDKEAGY